jgi:NADPH:quinone reductase-like Zn-dependent oxidoreductase
VITTAGSEDKLEWGRWLGADVAVNYKEQDFVEEVEQATDGHGADVILDNIGAKYLDRNIDALATEGRLVIIGMQGGAKAEIDLSKLLRKRAVVAATALRSRPEADKATICASVVENVWPMVTEGEVKPVIHDRYPLEQVARAHQAVENGSSVGKVLLTVRD